MKTLVYSRNSTTLDERRRHVRHEPSSIIYVELGPDNGGVLTNLGAGGLSLQAVSKLSSETELTLQFQPQGIEQPIETVGRVAWLGPTQKEAGICFKNLSGNTEQQIAEWIAKQEPTQVTKTAAEPHSEVLPTKDETPALRVDASVPVILPQAEPPPEPDSRSTGTEEVLAKDSVSSDSSWVSPSVGVNSAVGLMRGVPDSFDSESRRRRKLTIVVVATVIGILALILMVSSLRKPRPTPAVQTGQGAETTPSQGIPTDANSAPAMPETPEAVPAPQDGGWVARLKALFSMDDTTTGIDPALASVPVWAVQHSGFYYCSDSPYFRKLRRGTIMAQREALQSGYQPKLGSYCH